MSRDVVVVTTGGTIGARQFPGGLGKVIDTRSADATDRLVHSFSDVQVQRFCQSSSLELTPQRVLSLAHVLTGIAADGDVEGIVVTVGTDTLEEVAYLLDLFWTWDLPVVVTGSMRTPDDTDSDGFRNLADAIDAARAPALASYGVAVVFGGTVHDPSCVTKADPASFDAFRSIGGFIGTLIGGDVSIFAAPRPRLTIPIEHVGSLDLSVPLVTVVGGDDGTVTRAVVAGRVDGLVLAGTGAGNITLAVREAIAPLLADGTPVVIASRTGRPVLSPASDGSIGRAELRRIGCLLALGLAPLQARLLLLALLASRTETSGLQRAFAVGAR